MKTLVLDIESSPSLAHVWSLWNTNVSLSQLREAGQVICWAAKWVDSPRVEFRSDYHDGHGPMVERIHALLDEADAVVTYNGDSYDLKHLRREFLLAGMKPHAPVQSIDLYRVVKKEFKFVSGKLDFVSRQLGLGGKVAHTGHDLWVRAMASDPKAWATMKKYNRNDVVITEQLYSVLVPWISTHPHAGLIDGKGAETCKCGSGNLQRRGWRHTLTASYARFQCQDCGSWGSSVNRESGVKVRGI